MSDLECVQPGNCDFENYDFEFCSWLNLENTQDNFDWEAFSGQYDNRFGYMYDYTYKDESGHLALANSFKNENWARLFSEKLEPDNDPGVCLSFYFYFEGR